MPAYIHIGDSNNIAHKIKSIYLGDNNSEVIIAKNIYFGDSNGKAEPSYQRIYTSTSTYYTSMINSEGLSSTTALTRSSTSDTSYQTRVSTSSTSYGTRASTSDTKYGTRISTSGTKYGTRISTSGTSYGTSGDKYVCVSYSHIQTYNQYYSSTTLAYVSFKANTYYFYTNVFAAVPYLCVNSSISYSSYITYNNTSSRSITDYDTKILWLPNYQQIPLIRWINGRTVTSLQTTTGSMTTKAVWGDYYVSETIWVKENIQSVTTGTTYLTRSSTSGTTYLTRSSTSGTTYLTRSSTSGTTYLTRSSTSNTIYLTRSSTSGYSGVSSSTYTSN